MQPLNTKKNHATSWDEKKSHNILGQKNYATSWDKKITRPLGTKKSRKLLRQKLVGVGPVDNRPSTDKLHKKKVTLDI